MSYICLLLITKTNTMSEKIKIQSTVEPTERLSFNEWAERTNVSSLYIEPTNFYKGNSKSIGVTYCQDEPTFLRKLLNFFTDGE